jgi:uncharacterized protein (DUF433 family)
MASTKAKSEVLTATPREAAGLLDLPLATVNKAIEQKILVTGGASASSRMRRLADDELAALALLKDVDLGLPVATKRELARWVRRARPHRASEPPELILRGGLTVRYRKGVSRSVGAALRYLALRDRWIRHDAEIKGGVPVIAGTRISVYGVAQRIAHGDTIARLAEEYPSIPAEAFETAAAYARFHPRRGRPPAHRPWRATA